MLNIHELERQWLRYKIKSYAPYIGGILLFLIIVITVLLFVFSSEDTDGISTEKTETSTVPAGTPTITKATESPLANVETLKPIPAPPKQTAPNPLKSEVKLAPALSFLNTIETTNAPQQPRNSTLHVKRPDHSVATSQPKSQPVTSPIADKPTYPQKSHVSTENVEKQSSITIDTRQDEQDIVDVLKRFKKNKKPALSLFAAKRYYAIGNYTDAYNYALITNDINSDIEESWLIAAKALVKLNKQDDAVNLLNKFIRNSNSVRAKILLDQIRSGTME